MAEDHLGGADAGHRAEAERHNGYGGHVLHHGLPPLHLRDVGPAHLLQRAAVAAGRLQQPHERDPQLVRHLLAHRELAGDGRAAGRTDDGVVVARDDRRAAVDFRSAEDEVARCQLGHDAVRVEFGPPGQPADLAEAVLVDQLGDALANIEPAARAPPRQAGVAAHLRGKALQAIEFVDFLLPAHA